MSSNEKATSHSNLATFSIISCTPNEFNTLFDDANLSTDMLADDVKRIVITRNRERLREDKLEYRLDDLLSAMLEYAPHPLGKRYVAVALHIAQEKGEETVVDLANAWMEQLFLPMWTISTAYQSNLFDGQDPPFPHGSATNDFNVLNNLKSSQENLKVELGIRERHYCPISHTFDIELAQSLKMQKRTDDIPDANLNFMTPAPIIPFLLDISDGSCTISGVKIRNSAYTRSMIQSWTGTNIEDEVGSTWNIHTARNAIYMAYGTSLFFQKFIIYLDKEAYPDTHNKYKVREIIPNLAGVVLGDVTFPTFAESSIEPPSSRLLEIHAAIAKVLDACGADAYVGKLEEKAVRYQQALDDLLYNEIKVENGAIIDGSTPVIL